MAVKRDVLFTTLASEDLILIFKYIEQESPERASRYVTSIVNRIDLLGQLPLLGRKSTLKRLKKKGYRILVIDDFIVYYIADSLTVRIQRVVHGARSFQLS